MTPKSVAIPATMSRLNRGQRRARGVRSPSRITGISRDAMTALTASGTSTRSSCHATTSRATATRRAAASWIRRWVEGGNSSSCLSINTGA